MSVWIALFRGINVGGNNKLPMKELTRVMLNAGLTEVKTYIASGNVVFRSGHDEATLEALIGDLIETHFGFRCKVFLITLPHLLAVMAANPYKDHELKGKAQHVFFLKAAPKSVDHDLLNSLKAGNEAYEVGEHAIYLYAPDGIGRSKMVEKWDRAIKADMTARNLNTVETLLAMAREYA